MKTRGKSFVVGLALALGCSAFAGATQVIQFAPDGVPANAKSVGVFDWAPGNALSINGNPIGGIVAGSKAPLLVQARLTQLFDADGVIVPTPAGAEFTFVGAFPEVVVAVDPVNKTAIFTFDKTPPQGSPNFFEIWVNPPGVADSNNLAGTGFNGAPTTLNPTGSGKRILFGVVTDATGQFAPGTVPPAREQFDQSPEGVDDYPGILTIVGGGSTKISVNIISVDPDYFPGFGPTQTATLKALFNTSTITPFNQIVPSHLFVNDDAGGDGLSPPLPSQVPDLGPVNGGFSTTATHDFQLQADANESFEVGTVVSGACRVTYGGNDINGNIDLTKFGAACSSNKGNNQNCYTFGGQVGAPTANPALGGPFGEHTHHQVQGPAGDFVFRAGTHSAPKNTRITATACKDPGACRQAEANAGFKQIDFEGTGSFRTLDATAIAYLEANGAPSDIGPDNASTRTYYFRVDMDDNGEPGNKASSKPGDIAACARFLNADQNLPLTTADPLLNSFASCSACADVYQFYICKDATPCEQKDAIYAVRGFLTGGNIQLHQVIK